MGLSWPPGAFDFFFGTTDKCIAGGGYYLYLMTSSGFDAMQGYYGSLTSSIQTQNQGVGVLANKIPSYPEDSIKAMRGAGGCAAGTMG